MSAAVNKRAERHRSDTCFNGVIASNFPRSSSSRTTRCMTRARARCAERITVVEQRSVESRSVLATRFAAFTASFTPAYRYVSFAGKVHCPRRFREALSPREGATNRRTFRRVCGTALRREMSYSRENIRLSKEANERGDSKKTIIQ